MVEDAEKDMSITAFPVPYAPSMLAEAFPLITEAPVTYWPKPYHWSNHISHPTLFGSEIVNLAVAAEVEMLDG